MAICANLICAVFVFGSLRCGANYPALKNHRGNTMDPIADMLTRIRNAQQANKRATVIPYSGFKSEVLRVMKEAGFIENLTRRGRKGRRILEVMLRYDEQGNGYIQGIRRVSKQSKRIYAPASRMRPSRRGVEGVCIISTSHGVMTSTVARASHIGGEIICEIW